jgi:hypothetical protein
MIPMMRRTLSIALCGAALLARDAAAQPGRVLGEPARTQAAARPQGQIGTPHYDVVLEVPELSVDSIGLTVADLRAVLALDANAANLVSLSAGADVSIERVELEIVGVLAEAYVYVDLDNVARIVDRVVQSLDRNPQVLTQLLSVVDTAVGTVGGIGNTLLQPGGVAEGAVQAVGRTVSGVTRPGGLLTQTVNTLGQTVQITLDATGGILEQTLDTAGGLVSSRSLGQITSLPVLRETAGAAGQTVRQVRHASGAVLEYAVDAAGNVVSSRVVQEAGGGARP